MLGLLSSVTVFCNWYTGECFPIAVHTKISCAIGINGFDQWGAISGWENWGSGSGDKIGEAKLERTIGEKDDICHPSDI